MRDAKILQLCPINRRIDKVFVWEEEPGVASELWRQPVIACALYLYVEIDAHGGFIDEDSEPSIPYMGLVDLHPHAFEGIDHESFYKTPDGLLGCEFDGEQKEWRDEITYFLKKCQDKRDQEAKDVATAEAMMPLVKTRVIELFKNGAVVDEGHLPTLLSGWLRTQGVANKKMQEQVIGMFRRRASSGEYAPEIAAARYKKTGCEYISTFFGPPETLKAWRLMHPAPPTEKPPGPDYNKD